MYGLGLPVMCQVMRLYKEDPEDPEIKRIFEACSLKVTPSLSPCV